MSLRSEGLGRAQPSDAVFSPVQRRTVGEIGHYILKATGVVDRGTSSDVNIHTRRGDRPLLHRDQVLLLFILHLVVGHWRGLLRALVGIISLCVCVLISVVITMLVLYL
jgi:uncharacterized membrane protein